MFTDSIGREWNDFLHVTNELMTVMAGRLKLTIGRNEIIAEPGAPGPSFHKTLAA